MQREDVCWSMCHYSDGHYGNNNNKKKKTVWVVRVIEKEWEREVDRVGGWDGKASEEKRSLSSRKLYVRLSWVRFLSLYTNCTGGVESKCRRIVRYIIIIIFVMTNNKSCLRTRYDISWLLMRLSPCAKCH